jgi:hypothetical protein
MSVTGPDGKNYAETLPAGNMVQAIEPGDDTPSATPFSVTGWFKAEPGQNPPAALATMLWGWDGASFQGAVCFMESTTDADVNLHLEGAGFWHDHNYVGLRDGNWHFIAAVFRENKDVILQVDTDRKTAVVSSIPVRGIGLQLGYSVNYAGSFDNTDFDYYDFRAYAKALTDDDLDLLYTDMINNNGNLTLPHVG